MRLNSQHGPQLLSLACDLVWATTWMADANDEIAPRLGLSTLPVVAWPDTDEDDGDDRLRWKTRELINWAAGRPFVWVDDEITEQDRLFGHRTPWPARPASPRRPPARPHRPGLRHHAPVASRAVGTLDPTQLHAVLAA